MRLEHLHHHLNRRQLLGSAAKAGVATAIAGGLGGTLLSGTAGASADGKRAKRVGRTGSSDGFDDSHDHTKALDGTWAKESSARYGKDDQLGTLNEVTPEKTASALQLLSGSSAVATYRLGHLMRNGFPAFVNYPPRRYQQRLHVIGITPDHDEEFFTTATPGFAGEDEWRKADRERGPLGYAVPGQLGPNQATYMEERFPEGYTYQIGTQLDNLNHLGVGHVYYNGFKANEFCRATGTTELGMDHVSPFVTRGVLLDVLGWKLATGGDGVQEVNGHDVLGDSYRITIDDLLATMEWEGVGDIEPGDVVVIRTGWWQLAEDPDTYDQYLRSEPGIYLREAKFLAEHRPAVIAADTFGLEVLGHPDVTLVFPVHQLLLTQWGIRIGEGVVSDDLASAGAYEFVYSYSPQWAQGATAGNAPPMGLAPRCD
jgi:kynurenine formamidase